jgi:hypothetical protein
MKYMAGVMAITVACGGGGPTTTGPDASGRIDFTEQATITTGEIHLATGDVNNDGAPDLYMTSDAGAISAQERIALNDGTGILSPAITATDVQVDCTRPRLENIDTDNLVDVVCVPAIWGGASARLNRAGTAFAPAGYDHTPVSDAHAWSALPSQIVAATSSGLLALDVAPDATQMTSTVLAPDDFATLAVADLDGDGTPDLIAGTATTWSVFSGADRTRRDFAGVPGRLEAADLDRDGHPDLLAFSGTSIAISLVHGGVPGTPTVVDAPPLAADHFVVDHDGDGIPDVMFIGVGPQVFVMHGTGTGTLGAPERLYTDGSTIPAYMIGRNLSAVADVNRDGKIDLAIADLQTGVVRIWKAL